MNTAVVRNSRTARIVALGCVLVLVLSGALWWMATVQRGNRVTGYFGAAVGLYPGSEVRVLGMPVGSVSRVVPQGQVVRVDMVVDDDVSLPAGARAVAVAPSLVSDRYVQLTPAYTSGPEMADGAVIPRERTATPVELDELTKNLDEVTTALGPQGANRDGALSDFLNTEAANLHGNGEKIHQTMTQLSQVTRTLSDSRGDLFATVDNLQKFTETLAGSDAQVHQLSRQLADANRFLAGERGELAAALHELPAAMQDVQRFIADNRRGIRSNVDHLTGVTQALVDQRAALAEVLDVAPLALGNLARTYDPESGTVRDRANINELSSPPIVMVCKVLQQSQPQQIPPTLADACGKLAPVLSGKAPLPSPSETLTALQQGEPPPLPLPLVDVLSGGGL